MGKLEALQVERVDGVDRPATGHRWMIVKSEGEVEKDYAGAATAALEALAKEETLDLTPETVEALKALAALVGMEVEFKSVETPEAETVTEPETTEEPEAETVAASKDELKALVREALDELVEEAKAERDEPEGEAEVTKVAPKSKQPATGEAATLKKGEGIFENVIFGQ